MKIGWLLRISRAALHAAKDTLGPPGGSSQAQVRKNGAITAGLGLLLFCAATPILFFVPGEAALKVGVIPCLAGYAFVVVGGYRVLLGRSPVEKGGVDASVKRILAGIAAVVLFVFVPLAVIAGVGIALEGH